VSYNVYEFDSSGELPNIRIIDYLMACGSSDDQMQPSLTRICRSFIAAVPRLSDGSLQMTSVSQGENTHIYTASPNAV
jgi:hypothetical protein